MMPIPDGFVQNILAMNRNALGDYEAAEAYARQVIAAAAGSSRSHHEGHEQLIMALVNGGKLDEARALAATQVSVFPAFSIAGYRARRTRCCREPEALLERYAEAFRAAGVPE